MHEFGWRPTITTGWRAGSLVGHLLECGPQATGGIFTDWEQVPDWHNIGYPDRRMQRRRQLCRLQARWHRRAGQPRASSPSRRCTRSATPPPISCPTWSPISPQVQLTQSAPDRVRVERRARPAADRTLQGVGDLSGRLSRGRDGFDRRHRRRAQGRAHRRGSAGAGPRALSPQRGLPDFTATHIEALGAEASYGEELRAAPRARCCCASSSCIREPRGARNVRARTRLGRH